MGDEEVDGITESGLLLLLLSLVLVGLGGDQDGAGGMISLGGSIGRIVVLLLLLVRGNRLAEVVSGSIMLARE